MKLRFVLDTRGAVYFGLYQFVSEASTIRFYFNHRIGYKGFLNLKTKF